MAASHDGHVHKGRDFPVKDNRAQRGYRNFVKPGSRVELDHDLAGETLLGNHAEDDHFNAMVAAGLHRTVQEAKARGKTSQASKAQRQLNGATEARLAIRVSWCPGCINYLHNCQCRATAEARGAEAASLDFILTVQQHMRDDIEDARLRRKAEKKTARKALLKAQRKDGI
jgi:hypothetical protein